MPWDICDPHLYETHIRCDTAQGEVCLACIKLQEEEGRLLEAKAALEKQLEKCRQARTVMNRSHDRIISRLPAELVSLVFGFCFPPAQAMRYSSTIFPHDFGRHVAARLLLGAVCNEWRRIAWSTPGLWTELAVSLRQINDYQWYLEFIRDWLKRSGRLPLSLSISFNWSFRDDTERYKELMNEVNNVSDRWQTLEIKNARADYLRLFKAQPSSKPILRTLTIDGGYDTDDNTVFRPFQTAMEPKRVILNGTFCMFASICWERITSLHLSGCATLGYAEVLVQAQNLREVALDLSSMTWATMPVPAKPIKHSNIRDLYIELHDYHSLDILLGSTVFPGLVNLTINGCLPVDQLGSFFHRRTCQLDSLTILDARIYMSKDIITLLEATPSISRLEMKLESPAPSLPDALFYRLAETAIQPPSQSSDDPFLPNLRHLTYNAEHLYTTWGGDRAINWRPITSVFGPLSELENPRRRPLQTLEIFFKRGDSKCEGRDESPKSFSIREDFMSSFLDIRKAGLDLKMRYLDDQSDVLTAAHELLDKNRL